MNLSKTALYRILLCGIFVVLIICCTFIFHFIWIKNNTNKPTLSLASVFISHNQTENNQTKKIWPAPTILKIPKIGVDANIGPVGLTTGGEMGVPVGPNDAAWFDLGASPGQIGSAVIDGHSGWKNGIPAIFDHLGQLQKGDKIYVVDQTGTTTTFVVRKIVIYGKNQDASVVFQSNDGVAHLNLITCTGVWSSVTQSSSERLVVFADKDTEQK